MRRASESVTQRELKTFVLTRARGRTFHVTCIANVSSIIADGAIRPRHQGGPASPFGNYETAYFPSRGLVSVFDFRHATTSQLDSGWCAGGPGTALGPCKNRLALFFLSTLAAERLEPWPDWDAQQGQMLVPYVESGHPGPIELDSIAELLELTVSGDPSAHADAMLRGRGHA